jgi:cobalt-zinc-cadmium efflux system membrane fusion protein
MRSKIQVATVALHEVPRLLRATGQVQFEDRRVARVLAPVAGEVTGLSSSVGDHVRRNQPLFYLKSRDAGSAIEDHLDAYRDLDLAEKNLAMTKDLFDHQAQSKFALAQAQNDVDKAQARVARTEGALASIGIDPKDDANEPLDPRVPVTSPIDGVILERQAGDGQYVQPDPTPLVVVADLSEVWVEADVFERDLHLVKAGDRAEVTTAAYPDEQFAATVARVSDVLDPATRTVKVRFVVSNPTLRLKPEMFATVTLFVDDVEQGITIPASAVITEGDRTYTYVAVDSHTFARRNVDVSPDTADTRRVLKGLQANDRVVVTGALQLRSQEDRGE